MKQLTIAFLFLFSLSCAIPHYPKKQEKLGIFSNDSLKKITVNVIPTNQLKVQYLGCGNLLIKHKNEVILLDPFFSNNSGLKAGLGKIKFKPEYFQKGSSYMNQFGTSYKDISNIFITHSHYDHLLDLAYILDKDSLNKSVKIYADESAKTVIQNFLKQTTFLNSDSFVYNDNYPSKWININNEMRMLIIPTSHAPHLGKLHFMKGNTDSNYFNKFTNSTQKISANQFKEGHTFAFILDILQHDTITFRVLIKGAGCEVNNGRICDEIINEHAIDLAVLQIASANYTDCYPQNLLSQIKPKQVLITHWEDFFRPYAPKKIKTVRATNFNYFFKKVKTIEGIWPVNKLSDKFYMPKPGTMMIYEF
jgi:L-ascorbate metabolism protein UlaG (beta-lactamase superfamily)